MSRLPRLQAMDAQPAQLPKSPNLRRSERWTRCEVKGARRSLHRFRVRQVILDSCEPLEEAFWLLLMRLLLRLRGPWTFFPLTVALLG